MRIVWFVRAFVLILSAALAACEYGPPVIANGFSQAATFRASFSEGPPFEGTLGPGTILWQAQRGRQLTSVTITTADGTRNDYPTEVLQRLRSQRPVKDELWIFSARGIRLEDTHDIQRVRNKLPTSPKL
jgi:hypothetical protein